MNINQVTNNELDIIIFDVEHGNCAFVQSHLGESLLLDCGNKDNFSPAEFIYKQGWTNPHGIETVVISHHDNDHIADYKNTVNYLNPKVYYNNLIPLNSIEKESNYQIGDCKHEYIKHRKILEPCGLHIYSGIEIDFFQNNYKDPIDKNLDINYHSVVSFIKYGNTTICFPGDITNEGLIDLLSNNKNKKFLNKMIETNIFITPHHGRMSKEEEANNEILTILLKNMNPDIIISSDKKIDSTNENTVATDYYNKFSKGVIFDSGTQSETLRKVLTTRQDNTIHISVNTNGFFIQTNAFTNEINNFINKPKTF